MTLAAVLLTGSGVGNLMLLAMLFALRSTVAESERIPLPWYQTGWYLLGVAIRFLAAVGVLRRWGWTRWVYAASAVTVSLANLAVIPTAPVTIGGCVFTALVLGLLFGPAGRAWFRRDAPDRLAKLFG